MLPHSPWHLLFMWCKPPDDQASPLIISSPTRLSNTESLWTQECKSWIQPEDNWSEIQNSLVLVFIELPFNAKCINALGGRRKKKNDDDEWWWKHASLQVSNWLILCLILRLWNHGKTPGVWQKYMIKWQNGQYDARKMSIRKVLVKKMT